MRTVHSQSDLAYFRELAGAGFNGIASARREHGQIFEPSARQSMLWTPTAIGATIGVLGTRYIGNRKTVSGVTMGGLVGSVLGLGMALVWTSRRFTGLAARTAFRNVNAARDAHWLETHPINYA